MAERGSTMKSLKRAGVLALALAGVLALALGVKADPNPRSTNKDSAAFGYFDTTYTATAGGDTIFFGFPASFVQVSSLTASSNIGTQVIGSAATIRNVGGGTSNPRTGLPVVDAELVTITAATGEYVSRVYDASCNAIYYGVKVVGTGSVLVEASRCAQ